MEFGRNLTATNMRCTFWLKNKRLAGEGQIMGDGSLSGSLNEKQPIRVKLGFLFAPFLYVAGRSDQNGVAGRDTYKLRVGRD